MFLAGGGILGAIFSLLTIFLLDIIDLRLKSVKEVRDIFPFPLLGIVPDFLTLSYKKDSKTTKSKKIEDSRIEEVRIFARDLPSSPITHNYQMLQTCIDFLGIGTNDSYKIVVTSSISGEGKSTCSSNIAASAAYGGKKVCLVDADMRRPSQHKIWNLNNSSGLSNVLIGEISHNDCQREVMPGLMLLTAGTLPPNPVSILDSSRFSDLIEELGSKFDLVIIDSPPFLAVADPIIIRKYVDGLILVSRPFLLDYSSAKIFKERIQQAKYEVDGLIINGVRIDVDTYAYNYESYAYYTDSGTVSLYEDIKISDAVKVADKDFNSISMKNTK